jgi:wyosine [tRNA(Phe)-imidazoG37] synthetase (radical SAM superfamily)
MRGQAFYCRALTGESGYSLCINADMTVSCNCQDYDGTGHIGDLTTQSFPEILANDVTQRFRRELASGHFPTTVCHRCADLRGVARHEADQYLSRFTVPQGIKVENTSLCNLRCVSCNRQLLHSIRRRMSLSLEEIEQIAQQLQANHIGYISFFNLGEPFLSHNVEQELTLIRQYNPELSITVSTNGVLLDTESKRRAAMLVDHIYFSIDGASQESLEQYQCGGSFEKAYRNMCDLVQFRDAQGAAKPLLEWKYLLFRWNDHPSLIRQAIALAREARVDRISFWPTMTPPYAMSLRYRFGRFFRSVGKPAWCGRVIDFREQGLPVSQR